MMNLLVRSRVRSALAVMLIFIIITTGLFSAWLYSSLNVSQPITVVVRDGSSLSQIARQVAGDEILSFPALFIFWARINGQENSLRSGEYEVLPGDSPLSLLRLLTSGKTKQYSVTLIEGWTFQQALEAIWAAEKIQRTLYVDTRDPQGSKSMLEMLAIERSGVEGLLFPDTYFYDANASDLAIVRRAQQRGTEILRQQWGDRLGTLPFETSYEALILASIIEKESGINAEKSRISGVFIRRLEAGMRLQSDPTVIYGMGDSFTGNITRADLRQTTAYNTYQINGLPPTPIALAGRESIYASLHPDDSNSLYFVAKGDGSHYFSSNLEEHNDAVRRFQLQ